jgi:hypothetical protein
MSTYPPLQSLLPHLLSLNNHILIPIILLSNLYPSRFIPPNLHLSPLSPLLISSTPYSLTLLIFNTFINHFLIIPTLYPPTIFPFPPFPLPNLPPLPSIHYSFILSLYPYLLLTSLILPLNSLLFHFYPPLTSHTSLLPHFKFNSPLLSPTLNNHPLLILLNHALLVSSPRLRSPQNRSGQGILSFLPTPPPLITPSQPSTPPFPLHLPPLPSPPSFLLYLSSFVYTPPISPLSSPPSPLSTTAGASDRRAGLW